MSWINLVAIESVAFPNRFLRMDASNVNQSNGGGAGTVNCQYYPSSAIPPQPNIGNYEVFEIIPIPQVPNGGYALRSVNFSNAFLRIDGSQVNQTEGSGSGSVNCQYYASGVYPATPQDYEILVVEYVIEANAYYIRSGPFLTAYLRMDGSGITEFQATGGGSVNCQYYPLGQNPTSAQQYEMFNIVQVQSFGDHW